MASVKTGPSIDSEKAQAKYFLPYQIRWIRETARMALAEKSVRIGWTYCDAYRNVLKRLQNKGRDYLFQTKDEATAIEYVSTCYKFAEIFNLTKTIVDHDVETWKVERFDLDGKGTGFTDEVKVGVIKFDNGSRILAFSRNPNALRAFGGDVGWDEAAFHPAAEALWASASGRITWGYDIGVWSSHNGLSTLFNQFVREAQAGTGGWSYHRVDIYEAIKQGLVEKINEVSGKNMTREQFLADCKTRSRLPEIFAQEYECTPRGGTDSIVPWAVILANSLEYTMERRHIEDAEVKALFGDYHPDTRGERETKIKGWLQQTYCKAHAYIKNHRLGFDVAASGQGHLGSMYIESMEGNDAHLRALLTTRTEDWEFLKVCARWFMRNISGVRGAGDETGMGRQICWELVKEFPGQFEAVNFSREKGDLGVRLMNELTEVKKRFPKVEADIAQDFYGLRKSIAGGKVVFHEDKNPLNANSHCDIAWSGALASRAGLVNAVPVTMTLI
jgi:phage FluMu gp28-like protein